MAVIWVQCGRERRWKPVALSDQAIALREDPQQPIVPVDNEAPAIVMQRSGATDRILIARSRASAWVNGEAVLLGVRVLRDRDAIRIGAGETMFFSTESLAKVVQFSETRPVPCARCTETITTGSNAVKCPRCGAWHHQAEKSPCWTYSAKCGSQDCDQPAALDGLYHWNPEGI